nr:hypothetical protein [uncultured Nitrososphaera sp.]
MAHQIVLFVDRPGVIYKFMPEKETKLLLSLKNTVSKGVGKEITRSQAAALFKDVARLLELSVIVQEPDLLEAPVTSDGRPSIPELPPNLAPADDYERHDTRTKNMLDAETHATSAALPGVKVAVTYRDDGYEKARESTQIASEATKTISEIAGDIGKEIEAAKINDDINKKVGNDASVIFTISNPSPKQEPPKSVTPGEITNIYDEKEVFPDFYYSVDRHMFMVSDKGSDIRIVQIQEKKSYKTLAFAKLRRVGKNPDRWVAERREQQPQQLVA